MVQPKVLEGTGEELQRILAQFPHERFRLVSLPTKKLTIEQSESGAGK
ncbi:MAG: hypothetical protein JWN14_4109 [Chthonomonadales bacterium]|nr:hypothetical protein [Chthonomonadales bacterium]